MKIVLFLLSFVVGGCWEPLRYTSNDSGNDAGGDTDSDTDTDTDTGPPCGGVRVGGFCWYLGEKGNPCGVTCAGNGQYHEATRTFAGSAGTDENCKTVMAAIGGGISFFPNLIDGDGMGIGCFATTAGMVGRALTPATTRDAQSVYNLRACACTL